jgi:hypothetical protein
MICGRKQIWKRSLPAILLSIASSIFAAQTNQLPCRPNIPEMVEADGKLRLDFEDEMLVLPRGLQPSMLRTRTGALVAQAQIPEKPFPTSRMVYPSAMETRVSRDDGRTWTKIPLTPGKNGLNMEGGATQLRDGTILALDTYITPGRKTNEGLGQLYTSTNDWQTLDGPQEAFFDLPNVNFYASKDDGGHPHDAQRLHRRILELPNGDLVTTFYGQLYGDSTPSTYMPSMMKARVMLVRSKDRGKHWKLISTVAVGPEIGTEGFCEPVISRVSQGTSVGRLICLMRTGRELRETFSDDEGASWAPHYPRVFGGLDVYQTELWVDHFRKFKGSKGKLLDENNPDELRGAVVDPDLIELRSGILVAAFGVRIPQKACWAHPEHFWNGNYLAFSTDHGNSWRDVVRLTSGVLTTHYMAVEETLADNKIFVVYDLGGWSKGMNRDIYGRFVTVSLKKD